MAARFAREAGTVVLLSGGDLDCARYHILALRPWLTLSGRGRKTKLTINGDLHETDRAPLAVLQQTLINFHLNPEEFPQPVAAGLFGYLAYDLKDEFGRAAAHHRRRSGAAPPLFIRAFSGGGPRTKSTQPPGCMQRFSKTEVRREPMPHWTPFGRRSAPRRLHPAFLRPPAKSCIPTFPAPITRARFDASANTSRQAMSTRRTYPNGSKWGLRAMATACLRPCTT